MRINLFVAKASNLSRRAADKAIENGRIQVNSVPAQLGQAIGETDVITLDGKALEMPNNIQTIALNKPVGYVCSRDGQGSPTVYDLLPHEMQNLNLVGRLDKDSSGLILLTNDGELSHKLTHPSYEKTKLYDIELNQPLGQADQEKISNGIKLHDGISKLQLTRVSDTKWQVTMHEGRNRQIRRTFEALGYRIKALHRIQFGPYKLGKLAPKQFIEL